MREMEARKRRKERSQFIALTQDEKIKVARKKGPKTGYCECCKVDYTDATKVISLHFFSRNIFHQLNQ